MANCGGCGDEAGSGAVKCKGCDLWWHQSCSGMKKMMYELILLTSEECGDHCWCCRVCSSLQDGIKKSILALEAKYQQLDARITDNTDNIKCNAEKLECITTRTDQLCDTVDQLKVSIENVGSKGGASAVDKDDIFNEIREREARKCNIIVHGIPEPEDDSTDKGADDKAELKVIASAIGVKIDPNNDIKFCYRVGKKSDDMCRPLKAGFYDQKIAGRLTSTSWKLKDNKKVSYNSSIVKDLTYQQRNEEAKLRKDIEDKNLNLSAEDAKIYCFRLAGERGHRIIVKVKKQGEREENNSRSRQVPTVNSSRIQTRQKEKSVSK